MNLKLFLLIALSFELATAKKYTQCELAQELHGEHNVTRENLYKHLCVVVRSLSTGEVREGGFLGIYGIGTKWWCGKWGDVSGSCNMMCSNLVDDDIADDVACAKKVFEDFGLAGWGQTDGYCRLWYEDEADECFTSSEKTVLRASDEEILVHRDRRRNYPKPVNKHFTQCEFVRELHNNLNVPRDELYKHLCVTVGSRLNTGSVRRGGGMGIYGVGSRWWCGKNGEVGGSCNVTCASLVDQDIANDVACAQKVMREQGTESWGHDDNVCKVDNEETVNKCLEDPAVEITMEINLDDSEEQTNPPTLEEVRNLLNSTDANYNTNQTKPNQQISM